IQKLYKTPKYPDRMLTGGNKWRLSLKKHLKNLLNKQKQRENIMLIIDNEFRNLISPQTKEEFEQLENNIIAEGGIHDPIITWNNIIIDGHNRYDICIKNDLK